MNDVQIVNETKVTRDETRRTNKIKEDALLRTKWWKEECNRENKMIFRYENGMDEWRDGAWIRYQRDASSTNNTRKEGQSRAANLI